MSKYSSSSSSSGIGFGGLLQVAFIVLKLMGYINWSWLWVFFPTWGGILLIVLISLLVYWFQNRV